MILGNLVVERDGNPGWPRLDDHEVQKVLESMTFKDMKIFTSYRIGQKTSLFCVLHEAKEIFVAGISSN